MKTPFLTLLIAILFLPVVSPVVSFAQVSDVAPDNQGVSCVDLSSNIGKGAYGSDVFALQGYLSDAGYLSADPTGYFGNMTVGAVNALQMANGLSPTGYVGPLTRGIIKGATCPVTIGASAEEVSVGTSNATTTDYTQYSCGQLKGMSGNIYRNDHDLYMQSQFLQSLHNATLMNNTKLMANIQAKLSIFATSTQANYLASCGI